MDIVKLNKFNYPKKRSYGNWISRQNFGSLKQKPRTESRNLEGSK